MKTYPISAIKVKRRGRPGKYLDEIETAGTLDVDEGFFLDVDNGPASPQSVRLGIFKAVQKVHSGKSFKTVTVEDDERGRFFLVRTA